MFHTSHRPYTSLVLSSCIGWQKFLDQTGAIYYSKSAVKEFLPGTTMSSGNGTKFDLKLSLSPPRPNIRVDSPPGSRTVSPSSCVSSEEYRTSPEATSMVLVGCLQCLMYIMLSEEDPRCPKCKTTVLLHVIHDKNTATKNTRYSSKSSIEFPK